MTKTMEESEQASTSSKKEKGISSSFSMGNIRRIKVKNFLTYTEAELHPGPNLNLIIGPNGTGKSTIVCAICLGLAGKPSVLGRAGYIADYIQYGHSKALIELDLYHNSTEYCRISREIQKGGSSVWHLNGKLSNLKEIEGEVKRMNIQVDNLCQFLPQDRVAEFVKMSPQQLLEDTQKAVGLTAMYDKHMKLKSLRREQKEAEANTRTSSDQLEMEMEKNRRLEEEVRIYEQRREFIKSVETLKSKKLWVVYDVKRREFTTKKEDLSNARNDLGELLTKNEPYQQAVDDLTKRLNGMTAELRQYTLQVEKSTEKIRSCLKEIEGLQEKSLVVQQALKMKKQEEEVRLRRLATTSDELANLEAALANSVNNQVDVQGKLRENNEQLNACMNQYTEAQNETMSLKAEKSATDRDMNSIDQERNRIQDTASKQLELLQRRSPDAYKAVIFLRKNANLFKSAIYEPIMTTIIMKDKNYAKYVEGNIPQRDLLAFVCEDPDDLNKFMSIVKDQMGLRVNAVMVPKTTLDQLRPQVPIDHLRRFGFHYYLKDLITAPDGVMRYLCQMHRLHNVPVGNALTTECLDQIFAETKLTRFFTDTRRYSVKQSSYGARLRSTTSSNIRLASLLIFSMETERLNQLTTRLEELQKIQDGLIEKEKALQANERALLVRQEELRNIRKALVGQRDHVKNLQSQIATKQKAKQRLEQSAKDLTADTANSYNEISLLNTKKCTTMFKHEALVQARMELGITKLKTTAKMTLVTREKTKATKLLEEVSQATVALEEQVRTLIDDVKKAKEGATKAMAEAKEATGIQCTGINLSAEVKEKFGDLHVSIEDIDTQINQEQARVDCLYPVDKNVIREFQNRKKDIERMQAEVGTIRGRMEHFDQEIEELKNEWLPELNQLLAKVNTNFSEFFSRLKCVGEVSLKQGEDVLDFDKYGVCIKVKYRKEEPLHELSAFHQSGGERSVATILYMMALQELSKVPFRCVDEINQGMDANNERKVFEFVVETACQRNTSQYFLLTPKLLPKLSYSKNVVPHIIFNGPSIELEVRWNIKKLIRAAKKSMED